MGLDFGLFKVRGRSNRYKCRALPPLPPSEEAFTETWAQKKRRNDLAWVDPPSLKRVQSRAIFQPIAPHATQLHVICTILKYLKLSLNEVFFIPNVQFNKQVYINVDQASCLTNRKLTSSHCALVILVCLV